MAWLNYKVGYQANLLSATKLFTAAAANPVLRISCVLVRGLCLFHLAQGTPAQHELGAGLQQQAESKAALKAEDSLVIAVHGAIALIWSNKAPSVAEAAPAATETAGPVERETSGMLTPELCKALEHYKLANDMTLPHAQNRNPLSSNNSPYVRLLSKARAALIEHLPDDFWVDAINQVQQAGFLPPSKLFSGVSRVKPLYEYDSMAVILQAEAEGNERQGSFLADWAATVSEDVSQLDDIPSTSSSCQGCGKREHSPDARLMRCGKCKVYRYCSTECQRSDWPTHKTVCRELGS